MDAPIMGNRNLSDNQVEDFLGEGNHEAACQGEKALGTLGGIMALERETNLYNAPTQQNHTDCTDEGKDKVGKIVHHPQRIAAGGKGRNRKTAGAQHCCHIDRKPIPSFPAERQGVCGFAVYVAVFQGNKFTQRFLQKHSSSFMYIFMV